jgi:hypothetical protein
VKVNPPCMTYVRTAISKRSNLLVVIGDAGDGAVNNDPPYAHWAYTYAATQLANNYTCARADSSMAYDVYTGAFPWDPSEQDPPENDTSSTSSSGIDAELQMANATFFSSTAASNKWVAARSMHWRPLHPWLYLSHPKCPCCLGPVPMCPVPMLPWSF